MEDRRVPQEQPSSRIVMDGVHEYAEGMPVELGTADTPEAVARDSRREPRVTVVAWNEGGHNSVSIDLLDLIAWLRQHRPDLVASQR